MKKIFIKTGMPLLSIASSIMLVSCKHDQKPEDKKTFVQIHKDKKTFGQIHNLIYDGFYLSKQDYKDGYLWNNDTLQNGRISSNDFEKINESKGYDLNPAVMLGNNDSFYFIFNQDDNDGLKPSDFFSKIFFNDTSIIRNNIINKMNIDLGNSQKESSFGSYSIMPFVHTRANKKEGYLNTYIGSQSNHSTISIQEALKNIKKMYKEERANLILKYYGYKTTKNSKGDYEDDPSIRNHANRAFLPLAQAKQIFSYEQIDSHTFKITTHINDNFSITAAHFLIKENSKYKQIGSFSIGHKKEWTSYTKHKNAKYVGLKKIFL